MPRELRQFGIAAIALGVAICFAAAQHAAAAPTPAVALLAFLLALHATFFFYMFISASGTQLPSPWQSILVFALSYLVLVNVISSAG